MSAVVPEKSHAELGASVASRWMACPGSIQLSRTVPTPPTTAFAQEGTAAHALAELSLRRGVEPSTFVGTTLEGVEVTEDMADFVAVYVRHCRGFMGEGLVESFIEHRFNLAALNPPGPMFGTADFVWVHPESSCMGIVDLKYGQGVVVDAKGNKQLRYYALGAALSLGAQAGVDTITMTIVQPRVTHPEGAIRSETITIDELIAFAGELLAAARATTAPDAPLHPGAHCRFCPASGICPAQYEQAQALAQVDFAALDVANPEHAPPAPATLPDELFASMLGKLHILEDWAAAMRAHAKGRLERGEAVEGFKLVEGRANRRWSNPDETEQWLRAQGFDDGELFDRKLKSPAQVEKLVGKKNLPPDLVTKPAGALHLAPAHDARPAVEVTMGSEFALLPSGEE